MPISQGGSTARTKAVLLFDANLASPLRCRGRCRHDPEHLCIHRFGRHIRALRLPPEKVNAADLEVVKHFIGLAHDGLPGTTVTETRWLIVTRDKRFCTSIKHQYDSTKRPGRMEMLFHKHCILAVAGDQLMCIEVVRLSSKRGGVGKVADLQRAVQKVQEMLNQPRAL